MSWYLMFALVLCGFTVSCGLEERVSERSPARSDSPIKADAPEGAKKGDPAISSIQVIEASGDVVNINWNGLSDVGNKYVAIAKPSKIIK